MLYLLCSLKGFESIILFTITYTLLLAMTCGDLKVIYINLYWRMHGTKHRTRRTTKCRKIYHF